MDQLAKLVALTLPQFAAVVALFLPGFVSIRVDRLVQPGRTLTVQGLIVDAFAYSLLNAGVFGWAVWLAAAQLSSPYPNYALVWLYGLVVAVVGPVIWPFIFRAAQRFGAQRHWLLGPHRFAWDNFFSRNQPCWIIVHLKSGQLVGGYFGSASYATVEPESGHLYLEELWALDETGRFRHVIPGSKGALFRPTDYDWVELFYDGPPAAEESHDEPLE
ncbi:MAG TPA: DUF6338 family protein [Caulobacteraceae bacterium]|jgi:hypothetical protein